MHAKASSIISALAEVESEVVPSMAFHALRFGEKCDRHPPLRSRGVDTRIYAPEPQERRHPLVPPLQPLRAAAAPNAANPPAAPAATPIQNQGARGRDSPTLPPSRTPQQTIFADGYRPASRASSAGSVRRHADPNAAVFARPPSSIGGRSGAAPIAPEPAVPLEEKLLNQPTDAQLDAAFRRVDFNGNGMLSLAELDKAVVELWPTFNNKPVILRAYKAADRNGTGFISRKEFKLCVDYLTLFHNLYTKFQRADTNGDRRLSRAEFKNAVTNFIELRKMDDPDEIFDRLDSNKGGYILFDEFCAWFVGEKIVKGSKPSKSGVISSRRVLPKKLAFPPLTSIAETFRRVDFNGNGMLSLAELDKAVVELWPDFNSKSALIRAYKAADRNGTGFISRKEFPLFLRYLVAYVNIFNAFTTIDESGDRRLTEDEFVTHGGVVDQFKALSSDQRRALFKKLDTNGGGVLLFDEFSSALAEQAMKEVPAMDVQSEGTGSPLVVTCLYCMRSRPIDHLPQCRAQVQSAVDKLPSCLKFTLPPPPGIDKKVNVADFNNFARAAHDELMRLFSCPECPHRFDCNQAQAFATHFLQHNTHPSRQTRITQNRRATLTASFTYRPAPAAPPLRPSELLNTLSVAAVLKLEAAIDKSHMSREIVTVRQLADYLPHATPAQLQTLVKLPDWKTVWQELCPCTPTDIALADEQARRVTLVAETAPTKVRGLFHLPSFRTSEDADEFGRHLAMRQRNLKSMARVMLAIRPCLGGSFREFLRM